MAGFTTGVIDLSADNTFDSVIMGNGDTMTFSNAGTGGGVEAPIVVTGDFTVAGTAIITLRNNTNLTVGEVSVVGITRDLNAVALSTGTAGGGGAHGGGSNVHGGYGGGGSATTDGGAGSGYYGCWSGTSASTAGGTYPNGAGDGGGSGTAVCSGYGYPCGAGGGGGSAGAPGTSTESVSFYVQGNVSITGGTITGAGVNGVSAGGSGGSGGSGGGTYGGSAGGGGGGGAGGSGGNGGNLYLFHLGTAAEAFDTTTLDGGTGAAGGGAGGAGGGSAPGSPGIAGGAGTTGTTGIVELIEVDTTPEMTTTSVTNIFSLQATAAGTIVNNGGNAITERGFVTGASLNPDITDTKHIVAGVTTPYTTTLSSLTADTTYHCRAYATNSEGTAYGADIEFKTITAFVPRQIVSI